MKMLRIATVEDDTNDLEALRTHLKRYEKENGLKFLITEFRDGEDIVTYYCCVDFGKYPKSFRGDSCS